MLRKIINRLSFTKTKRVTDSPLLSGSTLQAPVNPLNKLHHKCKACILDPFIDAMCDGNYDGLVISGEPTPKEKELAYIDLFYEFIELIDEPDTKAILKLNRKIMDLGNKILDIRMMCGYIATAVTGNANGYVSTENMNVLPEYIERLRHYGYRYKFDITNAKAISRDLTAVATRSIKLEIDLELLQKELEAIEAKNKGEKPDRSYFMNTMTRIVEWLKVPLTTRSITVEEFCYYKRDYYRHIDRIAEQNAKNKKYART